MAKFNYEKIAEKLKILGDPTRIKILEILSCGECCACEIQEHFTLSQPTLSHHLNALVEGGFVTARKEGKWVHYTLETSPFAQFEKLFQRLLEAQADCLCHTAKTCTKKKSSKNVVAAKECSP